MAKANDEQTAVGEAPADFSISLDEFCARQSKNDKRVELLGAFYHVESLAGRTKDDESAFASRYAAFATQPA